MLMDLTYDEEETRAGGEKEMKPEEHATNTMTGNNKEKNPPLTTKQKIAFYVLLLLGLFIAGLGTFLIINIAKSEWWKTLNIFIKISYDVFLALGATSLCCAFLLGAIGLRKVS